MNETLVNMKKFRSAEADVIEPFIKIIKPQYPHIAEKIHLFWSTRDFNFIMNTLLNDSRDGERQGFPMEIISAIFAIIKKHDEMYPEYKLNIHADDWH